MPPPAVPSPTPDEPHGPGPASLTDPVALRAMAHPMRLKLLGMVADHGTLTASQAAADLGSTPAVTAYHLRTLAKYGFVEDADSSSSRERPWKLTEQGVSFSWDAGDPAGRALSRVAYAEWFDHVYRYLAHIEEFPQDVRDASSATEQVLHATPAEVRELASKIDALLEPFKARVDPALRPPDATPMEILVFTHPLVPDQHSKKS